VREKARQRKAEEFHIGLLRTFERDEGVPVVLLDPYADAVRRHGVEGWRANEEFPTAGDAIQDALIGYRGVVAAMPEFSAEGGNDRWRAFEHALVEYLPAAGLAVVLAQRALRESATGFSELTDPAFAGLVDGEGG
jgi:hypothetical protein